MPRTDASSTAQTTATLACRCYSSQNFLNTRLGQSWWQISWKPHLEGKIRSFCHADKPVSRAQLRRQKHTDLLCRPKPFVPYCQPNDLDAKSFSMVERSVKLATGTRGTNIFSCGFSSSLHRYKNLRVLVSISAAIYRIGEGCSPTFCGE